MQTIGIDLGSTFTDLVLTDGEASLTLKVPSTPGYELVVREPPAGSFGKRRGTCLLVMVIHGCGMGDKGSEVIGREVLVGGRVSDLDFAIQMHDIVIGLFINRYARGLPL